MLSSPLLSVFILLVGVSLLVVAQSAARREREWEGIDLPAPRLRTTNDPSASAATMSLVKDGRLYWWHADIGFKSDAPNRDEVDARSPFLLIAQPRGVKEVQLMWSTDKGPEKHVLLTHGAVHHIPLFARAEGGDFIVKASAALPAFHVPSGMARITDFNAMKTRGGYTDLPPGTHKYRLCLKDPEDTLAWVTRRRWRWILKFFQPGIAAPVVSGAYIVHVPNADEPNDSFMLFAITKPVVL
jgi:hypothetical protein